MQVVPKKELEKKFDEENKKIDERRKGLGLEKKRIFDDIEAQKLNKQKAIEENKKIIDGYEKKKQKNYFHGLTQKNTN